MIKFIVYWTEGKAQKWVEVEGVTIDDIKTMLYYDHGFDPHEIDSMSFGLSEEYLKQYGASLG